MTLVPRSLVGRLLAISALSTLAALLFAAFAIGHVLERFVMSGLDQRLDAQVAVLARAVGPDGRVDRARMIDLPPFGVAGSGWIWRIDGPAGAVRSSGGSLMIPRRDRPPPPPEEHAHPHEHRRGEGPDMDVGDIRDTPWRALHYRRTTIVTTAGPVTITAAGPRAVAERPLRAAMTPLLISLATLGIALALATWVQVRLGLQPLRRLAASVAAVRAGDARTVPDDQPAELMAVAAELNALIEQNAAGLEHARRHVANLAHGLKTPLAALTVRLAEPDHDPDGGLRALVDRIDRQVRHHLGRARASAPGSGVRVRTPLNRAIGDLTMVLRRVHADRVLDVRIAVPDGMAVAVDPQDLDEMVGNLLDNGWRHARGAVRIEAARDGAAVHIRIDDDGPGLSEAAAIEALVPGRRLDERGDGHGFGLSITRALAELNGGRLILENAPELKGLRAILILPVATGDMV
ncbi:MAG TPA: HAMP domain-containing sensor histidine kinase [Sphingomonas sp.]|jgi:signal transduction histidine kinase|uniref:sensor histidine kinase n=1 Tax=Sphingomonas sp. TaxID=28214 RepID=UPI002ED8D408